MTEELCWLCDSADVVYTDAIGCRWCAHHYDTIYSEGV
jgi:hypothetical protein